LKINYQDASLRDSVYKNAAIDSVMEGIERWIELDGQKGSRETFVWRETLCWERKKRRGAKIVLEFWKRLDFQGKGGHWKDLRAPDLEKGPLISPLLK